jgi:uncharacterized protein YraI
MKRCMVVLCLIVASAVGSWAQEPGNTGVYLTTQFDLNLRGGPGQNWEVITTLPPGTTLPVIGRTADTQWLQVAYSSVNGWLSTRYVVWTGDVIELPVDGVGFEAYVRRVGVLAYTVRETPYYREWVDPANLLGVLPPETQVEVIGRLGYARDQFFNVMVLFEGQHYWVGAWNLDLEAGRYTSVLDNAYRNAYTRMVRQFDADIATGLRRLSRIEELWRAIQRGEKVSCAWLPGYLDQRTTSDTDLTSIPRFHAVALTLDDAIGYTNTAIASFEDACNRDEAFVTQADARLALNNVNRARQNFNVARSLLVSLGRRDPLVGDVE